MPMYHKRNNVSAEEWELLHAFKRAKRSTRIFKRSLRTESKTISFLKKDGDNVKVARHKINKENLFKKKKE